MKVFLISKYYCENLTQKKPEFCNIVSNKGQILEESIRKSNLSLTKVAEKTGISRRTLYNLFTYDEVEWDVFVKVGQAIGHDFTSDFPLMKNPFRTPLETNNNNNDSEQLKKCNDTLQELMKKHIDLQDAFIKMQKRNTELEVQVAMHH